MQWRPADHKTNERVQYKGAVDVLRRIYRAEGLSGWYKV